VPSNFDHALASREHAMLCRQLLRFVFGSTEDRLVRLKVDPPVSFWQA
jgi:hypothetical protein